MAFEPPTRLPGTAYHDPFEVEGDEYPYSDVPDWVTFGAEHDRDVRVYAILRAHVNRQRKDDEAWPSQATVATLLGLSKPDEVGKSIGRLEAMGALSRRVVPYKSGVLTKYRLWREPAPGHVYTGPRKSSDLYAPGMLEQLHAERVVPRKQPNRSRGGRKTAG